MNESGDISTNFGDFTVLKIVPCNKIINGTCLKKDEENSAHHFGDPYLANYAVKISAVMD